MKNKLLWNLGLVLCAAFLFSCNAPRNIIASGKVTPKGAFKAGGNMTFNVSSAPLAEIGNITVTAINAIDNRNDSIIYNETVAALSRGLMAYALDPVNSSYDLYIRYGIADRVDAGYKFASGAHVFDVMYQFMGSTGTADDPEAAKGMHGSFGIQYSGQKSKLPSKLGLDRLSSIFSFGLSRKDVLIPLVFSVPFGPEEQYGNLSFGVAYGHTFIKYGFDPSKEFVRRVGDQYQKIPSFSNKVNYGSYGAFVNAKIGFKYAYLLPSLSMYYQDYGTYNLFGFQQERYKGFSFIPSLGLQFNINPKKKEGDYAAAL